MKKEENKMAKFNHGDYKIETLCVQAGYEPENAEARVLPIVQSTTYQYNDIDDLADLFDLKKLGHFLLEIVKPNGELAGGKGCGS